MASVTAKKAAGTYVPDMRWSLPSVLAWLTQECRHGTLSDYVRQFCENQEEKLEQPSVIVEGITDDCIQCRIPFSAFDHESDHTFQLDVKLSLDPVTGVTKRLLSC